MSGKDLMIASAAAAAFAFGGSTYPNEHVAKFLLTSASVACSGYSLYLLKESIVKHKLLIKLNLRYHPEDSFSSKSIASFISRKSINTVLDGGIVVATTVFGVTVNTRNITRQELVDFLVRHRSAAYVSKMFAYYVASQDLAKYFTQLKYYYIDSDIIVEYYRDLRNDFVYNHPEFIEVINQYIATLDSVAKNELAERLLGTNINENVPVEKLLDTTISLLRVHYLSKINLSGCEVRVPISRFEKTVEILKPCGVVAVPEEYSIYSTIANGNSKIYHIQLVQAELKDGDDKVCDLRVIFIGNYYAGVLSSNKLAKNSSVNEDFKINVDVFLATVVKQVYNSQNSDSSRRSIEYGDRIYYEDSD